MIIIGVFAWLFSGRKDAIIRMGILEEPIQRDSTGHPRSPAPPIALPLKDPVNTQRASHESNSNRLEVSGPNREAPAPTAKVDDVMLRDDKRNLLKMNQGAAAKACAARGMRLPTIRELAKMGQSRGAKGILETRDVRDQDLRDGFSLVTATNPDGKKDHFYYNPTGYVESASDSRDQWFWSSSDGAEDNSEGGAPTNIPVKFTFDDNGKIHDHYNYLNLAVRCIRNQ